MKQLFWYANSKIVPKAFYAYFSMVKVDGFIIFATAWHDLGEACILFEEMYASTQGLKFT